MEMNGAWPTTYLRYLWQCNQMDKLFIQYLLIEKKLKLVQWHEIFAMVGSKYSQVLN